MYSHSSLLGIDTRAQHRCGAEDDTYIAPIHRFHYRFLRFLILALLNEAYLVRWDVILLYQLTLNLRINIPLARLVSTQVAEDKLCSLLFVILLIVVIEELGTVAGFVVYMVRILF